MQPYQAQEGYNPSFDFESKIPKVRTAKEMRINLQSPEALLKEALIKVRKPELLAQSSYYDDLESDWRNGRRYWFRDNAPITQEMLNTYCAENLSYTGGLNFIGRKLPYTKDGRTPIRCQYQINLNLAAGGEKGSFGVSGPFTHFRDLPRITPLCQSFYSNNHWAHSNGTRCGIYVPPAGKGTLTR